MKKFYTTILLAATAFGCMAASGTEPAKALPLRTIAVTPEVLPATEITETGFTANWEAVAGAEGYCMFVYEPVQIESAGTYRVLDESFNLVNKGSTVEPEFDGNFSCSLDKDYDFTFTPDWTVIGCAFAKGMVSGNIYTPTTDLTNNDGKYTLVLDIVGQQGTIISVKSVGSTTVTKTAVLDTPGGGQLRFDFENGNHETYLYIVDMGIEGDDDGTYANVLSFFDNIAIEQDLQAGDTVLRLVTLNDNISTPATSARFDNMKFLYDAKHLCYDFYAAYMFYNDPDDPWDYDVDYSNFSALQPVDLATSGAAAPEVADPVAEAEYYDLTGRRVTAETLAPGIYIERRGNATRKIAVN